MSVSRKLLVAIALIGLSVFGLSSSSVAEEASRRLISRTTPAYPDLASRMHLTGVVKVEAIITPAGNVREVLPDLRVPYVRLLPLG